MAGFWENHEKLKEYPELQKALQSVKLQAADSEKVYTDITAVWKKGADMFSTQLLSFAEEKPAAIIGVELLDKETGLLLQTDYINKEDFSMMEEVIQFPDVIRKENKTLCQKVHFMWLEPDGTVKTADCEKEILFPVDGIVESTTVFEPRAKNNKETIVLYGREPYKGETEDYKYKDNIQKNGKVRAMLPVRGEVLFSKECPISKVHFDGDNAPKLQLFFETGDVPVCYQGDYKKAFIIDGQKLSFHFDTDWGTDMDVHRFKVSTIVKLHLTFKVTVKWKGIDYTVAIIVKSLGIDTADTATTVIIEPISVRWGCLGKDTMVEMADYSRRKISDIRPGDYVRTLQGIGHVVDIFRGYEEEIIYLETSSGRNILLTGDHPVQTDKGIKRAEDVFADDRIMTETGQYEEVTALYMKKYQDTVYNLWIGGERTFYANGLLVGDFEEQNMAVRKKQERWTPEVQKLKEEMKKLVVSMKSV